jgi:hypothetical protein
VTGAVVSTATAAAAMKAIFIMGLPPLLCGFNGGGRSTVPLTLLLFCSHPA